MATLSDLYTHLKTLCEQWFYNKSQVDTKLDGKSAVEHSHGNISSGGAITTLSSYDPNDKIVVAAASSNLIKKVDMLSATKIIDANSAYYTNLGCGANEAQITINSRINTAIGNISNINAVQITNDKGTATADKMGSLWIEITETGGVTTTDVWFVKEVTSGGTTTYEWEDLDYDILENLSIDWTEIENNPFINASPNDYATSSHVHGNLTSDGKVGSTANYFIYTTTGGAITSKQKIGNITTAGAIGTAANKPVITLNNGVLGTGSFGTAANTFCEGNDSRLSDARTPTAHAHGNIGAAGTISTDVTFNSKLVITNSNNVVGTATAIDVLDSVVQSLINYGS